jgi:hypothetical protein
MMKRYINMPLKYALPLLFIGLLVLVSISGCIDNTTNTSPSPSASSATTTPSAAASAAPAQSSTNGHDPLLSAIAAQIQKDDSRNAPTIKNYSVVKNYTVGYVGINETSVGNNVPQVAINEHWTDSSGVSRSLNFDKVSIN